MAAAAAAAGCGGQLHLISIHPPREEKQEVSSHSNNEIHPPDVPK